VNNKDELGDLLRVEEFAARLNIKPATARAWLLKRRIARVRIASRAIRIPASEVERIIAEGTIPAREDRRAK
jgi:excisionase family DNA binding protein